MQRREIIAVYDSEHSRLSFEQRGFYNLVHMEEFDPELEGEAFAIVEKHASIKLIKQWREGIRTRFAYVPLASEQSEGQRLADYVLSHVLSIDYEQMMRHRDKFGEILLNKAAVMLETVVDTFDIVIHQQDNSTKAFRQKDLAEFPVPFIDFLTVSLANRHAPNENFILNGELSFDGFVHSYNNKKLKKNFLEEFDRLQTHPASVKGNVISFEDGLIVDILIGGVSYLPFFQNIYNKERLLYATKIGFGCLDNHHIDWKKNALTHEGIHGFHVGIGLGDQTPEVTFITSHHKILDIR